MERLDGHALDIIMGQLPDEDKMRLRQTSTALRLACDRDGVVIRRICREGGPYKRALSLRNRFRRFYQEISSSLFLDEGRKILERLNVLSAITKWQGRAKEVKRLIRRRALFARKRAELNAEQYRKWSRRMESSARRTAEKRGENLCRFPSQNP